MLRMIKEGTKIPFHAIYAKSIINTIVVIKMKILFTAIILLTVFSATAQRDHLVWDRKNIDVINETDTTKIAICKERGHIFEIGSFAIITPKDNRLKLIDYPDSTVSVDYRKAKIIRYRCLRCLQWIEEKDEPERMVIWRKRIQSDTIK